MAKRFREHGADYFRFLTTPGVAPTNNLAEQAIRFVVIDRLITQGTRSQRGRRWSERIWTAIATCTQQGRSVFEYLRQSVVAMFNLIEPQGWQTGLVRFENIVIGSSVSAVVALLFLSSQVKTILSTVGNTL